MSQAFDHIVQELDQISQQEKYALRVILDEQLASENGSQQAPFSQEVNGSDDPLLGLRVSTGIADLAEHFDEYRFGRKTS